MHAKYCTSLLESFCAFIYTVKYTAVDVVLYLVFDRGNPKYFVLQINKWWLYLTSCYYALTCPCRDAFKFNSNP